MLDEIEIDAKSARTVRNRRSRQPARRAVLRSFEERDAFLEDVRVADTVLVLDALARQRGVAPEPLVSPMLPRNG